MKCDIVGLASDHAAYPLKQFVKKYLDETEDGIAIKPEYLFVQNEIIIHFMD